MPPKTRSRTRLSAHLTHYSPSPASSPGGRRRIPSKNRGSVSEGADTDDGSESDFVPDEKTASPDSGEEFPSSLPIPAAGGEMDVDDEDSTPPRKPRPSGSSSSRGKASPTKSSKSARRAPSPQATGSSRPPSPDKAVVLDLEERPLPDWAIPDHVPDFVVHRDPREPSLAADFAKFVGYTPKVLREVFGVYPTAVAGRHQSGGCFAAGTACEPDPGLLPPTPPAARSPLRPYAPGRGRRSWRFEYGSLSAISAPHWSSRPSDFVGPDAPYDAPSTGFSSAGFLFPRTHPLFGSPARCTHCAPRLALHLLRCLAPSHPSALPTLRLLRPLHPAARSPLHTRNLRCTRCASAASLPTLQCVRALHHAPRFDRAPASAPCPGASPRPRTSLLASLCPTLTLVPTLRPHPTPTLRTARLASPKRPRPRPLLLPREPRHLALHASPSTPTPCFASRLPRFARTPRLASPQQTRSRPQAPRPSRFALHAHALLYLTLAALRPHAAPRFAPANALPPLACTPRLASPQCPRFALAHASPPPASRFAPHPALRPCASPQLRASLRFSARALAAPRASPCPRARASLHPAPCASPQRPRVAPAPACRPAPSPAPRLLPRPRFAALRPRASLRPSVRTRAVQPHSPLLRTLRLAPAPRVLPQRPRVALAPACRPSALARSSLTPAPALRPPHLASPQRTHPRSPAPLPAPSAVHDRVPAHRTTATLSTHLPSCACARSN
ncbi:hypothetical protein B0H14DRAFT_3903113 [Mycena olivaceomarginata]|nr:hypothetical protein B0H14DRAFT_3903113 [Mycena olivaceomarginata]